MLQSKWAKLLSGMLILFILFPSSLKSVQSQPGTTCSLESGQLMVNGSPFFPLGFYHVSWAGDDNQKRAAVYRVAEAGFNVIHMALDMQDEALLDMAYDLGIYVVIINDDPEGLQEVVRKFGNHPAVLGWNIADDFSIPRNGYTPSSVRAKHDAVKQISSAQCTYISSVTTYDVSGFMTSSDLMGIQVYPVPYDPLKRAFNNITTARTLAQPYARPIIANVQAFAWRGYRAPTYDEIRNLTYQTLLAGASGILFYTYFDPYWNFEQHPELWRMMSVLASEVKMLMPVLLEGEFTPLPVNHPSVLAGAWSYHDEVTVVVVNTSGLNTIDISLQLPYKLLSQPRVIFPSRSEPFKFASGVLSGKLQPVDIQVLQAKQ